jgi:epsilon-lactone hydrolase
VNLALTLRRQNAVQRQNVPLPGAVLSMSPAFDMELKNKSIEANASLDKMLSRDLLRGFIDSMLDGTGTATTDPRINLAHADPAGLPPTMIYYGEYEILTDDAIEFAGQARAAGVDLELRSLPEGQHIFYLGPAGYPRLTRRSRRWRRGCSPRSGLRQAERPRTGAAIAGIVLTDRLLKEQ